MRLHNAKPAAGVARGRTRMRRLLLGGLLLTVVGCGRSLEPRPLDVTIEASQTTAATGETLFFVVDAQGQRLTSIQVNYGDGVTDQVGIRSAQTAGAAFRHAYTAAGTYQVRATALDAVAGSKDVTVEVSIR